MCLSLTDWGRIAVDLPHLLLCVLRQVLLLQKKCKVTIAIVSSCSAGTATCLLPNYMIAAHAHLSLARVS